MFTGSDRGPAGPPGPAPRRALRWVIATDDALGYLRETADERILVVVASRSPWSGALLPASLVRRMQPETLYGDRRSRRHRRRAGDARGRPERRDLALAYPRPPSVSGCTRSIDQKAES